MYFLFLFMLNIQSKSVLGYSLNTILYRRNLSQSQKPKSKAIAKAPIANFLPLDGRKKPSLLFGTAIHSHTIKQGEIKIELFFYYNNILIKCISSVYIYAVDAGFSHTKYSQLRVQSIHSRVQSCLDLGEKKKKKKKCLSLIKRPKGGKAEERNFCFFWKETNSSMIQWTVSKNIHEILVAVSLFLKQINVLSSQLHLLRKCCHIMIIYQYFNTVQRPQSSNRQSQYPCQALYKFFHIIQNLIQV